MNALEGEAKLLIRELKTLELVKLIETEELQRIPKSAQVSERARKQGNALYVKQHHTTEEHFEILKFYCKSITFAPNQSEELACAYGNRSALLFHLKKWSECIQDVERALAITLDENLRIKLTKRRDKSLQLFNLTIELEKRRKELSSQLNGHNSDEKLKNLDESSKLSLENNNDNLLSRKKLCDSVKIQHSAKYGRYLAAKRDIRPGEIILVEKPYVNSFNTQNLYPHCGHCLAVNWAGVPCEHCGWMMYCSEKCRKDAWEQYHDIECFCIFYICYFSNHAKEYTGKEIRFDGIGIRVLLKALKEAGSLEKLKVQMKSVDQCADPCKRGFSKNGRFESDKFISLYSLSHSVSRSEKKGLAIFAAIALTCIAKYTKFFGEAFKFSVNALLESSNAIFIGSLLLRLSTISSINSHCVLNATDKCKYFRDEETCIEKWCCTRGTCILPIASLTNNNCSPNASRCYTEDQKLILFAIQPIKKNSQVNV
ncbi:SET and MYND domain-containing protein 4-like [Copidosoma floridanum]|uniref:SET and MYND domain-containing protein 4-like n=1 Tax=Copidosoma floridanum TaxID=29053 RepID=UPI0006C9C2FF|nr:SET and MYND domain-containing protein 4-like [Copidosoma floridanum]